ncbi:MAG: haloacid dehalogenase-like hydrolase [Verrucomicrobiota bacterium]
MRDTKDLSETPPAGIGLFDLDGTLLAWDCQLLFRHHVIRREPWRMVFLPVFLGALPFGIFLGAGGLKRFFLSYLCGMRNEDLFNHSRRFAESVLPTMYPEMLARIEARRMAGDFLILASASPECYVNEMGRLLGFDLVLATEVRHGGLIPPLINNKAGRKVERLRGLLPGTWYDANARLVNSHGYTDSTADLPMLGLCHDATVVNPGEPLTALAVANGWEIVTCPRPWKTKAGFLARVIALMLGIGRDPGGLKSGLGKNPTSPGGKWRV